MSTGGSARRQGGGGIWGACTGWAEHEGEDPGSPGELATGEATCLTTLRSRRNREPHSSAARTHPAPPHLEGKRILRGCGQTPSQDILESEELHWPSSTQGLGCCTKHAEREGLVIQEGLGDTGDSEATKGERRTESGTL